MTKTEQKVFDYAVKVNWNEQYIDEYISNPNIGLSLDEFQKLDGLQSWGKTRVFVSRYKPNSPESITLPIDDYNRLRKLEIKKQIKKLKKELKGL